MILLPEHISIQKVTGQKMNRTRIMLSPANEVTSNFRKNMVTSKARFFKSQARTLNALLRIQIQQTYKNVTVPEFDFKYRSSRKKYDPYPDYLVLFPLGTKDIDKGLPSWIYDNDPNYFLFNHRVYIDYTLGQED